MDIGDERHMATGGTHIAGDVSEVGGVGLGLGGDADDFAAHLGEAQNLGNAGRSVPGVGGDHGLDAHRVSATHAQIAHQHLAGGPTGVAEKVRTVGHGRLRDHLQRCIAEKRAHGNVVSRFFHPPSPNRLLPASPRRGKVFRFLSAWGLRRRVWQGFLFDLPEFSTYP